MKVIMTLSVAAVIAFSVIGCCALQPIKTIHCPDGEPVNIVCDVSKAYPVYAKTYDITLKAVLKKLEKQEVGAEASMKETIKKLRQDLDNRSSRLEMRLKTIVMGLQNTPCDKQARSDFRTMLADINKETDRLEQLDINFNVNPQRAISPQVQIRKEKQEDRTSQTATMENSAGGNIYQAERNIYHVEGNIYQVGPDMIINTIDSIVSVPAIKSLTIEVRLTCDLKDGAEIPPAEVFFVPVGDAHSYLKGVAGITRLNFRSPVNFQRPTPNKIVVINRFALESGSALQHKPVQALKNYNILSVPVVTIVYGKSFKKFTLLEVSLIVNGQNVWYVSYEYDVPFQAGPRFKIPLEELHKIL